MAMAWITKIRNSTTEAFTVYQDDGTWHPTISGRQYGRNEPIVIPAMTPKDTVLNLPPNPATPWMPQGRFVVPYDMITVMDVEYCVVPWQGSGRLRLVSERTKNAIDFQVGPFVQPDKDHFRGVHDDGKEVFNLELGPQGGAWWTVSYNFAMIISPDQGIRFAIESVSRSPLQQVVASLGDELMRIAPAILEKLITQAVLPTPAGAGGGAGGGQPPPPGL